MQGLLDRLGYALIGLFFGALIGVAGWWLYGVAHSVRYRGPGMDPLLRHWVQYGGAIFGVLGFLLRERAADVVADTLSAMFHFEFNPAPGRVASAVLGCVVLVIAVAAIWFTSPIKG